MWLGDESWLYEEASLAGRPSGLGVKKDVGVYAHSKLEVHTRRRCDHKAFCRLLSMAL